jgi:hypothetical protein
MQEAWERSMVFTQFLCFLHVFSNHVCQVHQVRELQFLLRLMWSFSKSSGCFAASFVRFHHRPYLLDLSFPLWFGYVQCLGPSMLPTFNVSGDILLLEHLSVTFEKIRAGDVVMARSPVNPRVMVCKRVLGLEGDRVTVHPTSSRGQIRHIQVRHEHNASCSLQEPRISCKRSCSRANSA